nr:hypothetical protein Itr_chr06CG13650 [Ipomoea trifida]
MNEWNTVERSQTQNRKGVELSLFEKNESQKLLQGPAISVPFMTEIFYICKIASGRRQSPLRLTPQVEDITF